MRERDYILSKQNDSDGPETIYIQNKNSIITFDNAVQIKTPHSFRKPSQIYKVGDKIIKRYKDGEDDYVRLQKEVFDILKKSNLPAFMKLRDVYTEDVQLFVDDDFKEMITAYSYDYIETINKKMIDLPMEYTLSSMCELKKLVEFLNNNNVLIGDSSAANCLVTEDNLVVIDPDYFEINDKCEEENLKEINHYISDLWCEEYGLKSMDDIRLISKQFYDKNIDLYLYKMNMRLTEETPREFITKTLQKNRRI